MVRTALDTALNMDMDHQRLPWEALPLREVITPSTTISIFKTFCPWTPSSPLNFNEVEAHMDDLPLDEIRALCMPALISLSKIPPFTPLIPLLDAESETYPMQLLGLQLLLDQAPRALFEGGDMRWTFGYFDQISQMVAREVSEMEDGPLSRQAWEQIGYVGVGHWIYYRTWFTVPFVHADSRSVDGLADQMIKSSWGVVEVDAGCKNDWLENYLDAKADPTAFVAVLTNGPEKRDGKVTTEGYLFWWLKLMATRKTVRNVFGRHPTRNGYFDRKTTQAEETFLEEIEYWSCPDENVVAKIKDDVKNGVWTPFKT